MSRRPALRCLHWLALPSIVLLSWLPLLLMFAANLVANLADCALDEGGAHRCLILGRDWGDTLYQFLVGGWMMLFTLPLGALLLLLWLAAPRLWRFCTRCSDRTMGRKRSHYFTSSNNEMGFHGAMDRKLKSCRPRKTS